MQPASLMRPARHFESESPDLECHVFFEYPSAATIKNDDECNKLYLNRKHSNFNKKFPEKNNSTLFGK